MLASTGVVEMVAGEGRGPLRQHPHQQTLGRFGVAVAALHGKQLVRSILANDPSGNMNSLQQESSLNINTWQGSYPYLTQR